ncbi:hypothetical protein [Deinococcus sp. Leaf326]|uniref:hypothetical protein n=1 Tax=Deinococcus sp. Leaf326 TaxID=1736338 RepID=UPI000701C82E|nr:hypothetical protein [Deinococcus sp. Leaf326]KQR18734.1 hypothetical protein ASF71_20165 [Deinococcus sp. Leaf326]
MDRQNDPCYADRSARQIEAWLERQRRRVQEIVARREELAATEAQQRAEGEEVQRRWELPK